MSEPTVLLHAMISELGAPYVPVHGRVPPRAVFEDVPVPKPGQVTADLLATLPAWSLALELYEAGYFWETHEVLEPLWLATTPNSRERFLLQAVIQLANACLKVVMQQPKAAVRLLIDVNLHLARVGPDRMANLDMVQLQHELDQFQIGILTRTTSPLTQRPTLP